MRTLANSDTFSYKATGRGNIRLMPKDSTTYRKIVAHLDNCQFAFRTFQLKEERAFRIVVKGLHHTTPIEEVKEAFVNLGHNVRDAKNAVSRVTKMPLSMFFINLEPAPTNKKVFEINRLCHAVVSIEEPKKFDEVVQCFRCQAFGHTKRYCKLEYVCVKCGLSHDSLNCMKAKEDPPVCGNCGDEHTASYRGCRIYIEAKKRFSPKPKAVTASSSNPAPHANFPASSAANQTGNQKFSYANVARAGAAENLNNNGQSPLDALEERMMRRMESMMNSMFNQFQNLVMTMLSNQNNLKCP